METAPHPRLRGTFYDIMLLVASIVLYSALAFTVEPETLVGDEARYVAYAENMTQGFYVRDEHPDFLNGPAYPLVLLPFVASNTSFLWARILNGVFIGLAAVFLFRTVRHYSGRRWGLAAALTIMLHPNSLRTGTQLLTEPLTLLCVTAFAWSFCHCLRSERRVWWWAASSAVALAALVMTRVIFGHVIVVMLVLLAVLIPFMRSSRTALVRAVGIMAAAFFLCTPYLAYTKAKTGKNLCWSTVSGELLYWMTSTNPGENGSWFSYEEAMTKPEVAPFHGELFARVTKLHPLERDAAFMEAAKEHVKANPKGVLRNWVSNVARLCFNTPRSHQPEDLKTTAIILYNAPLLAMSALALVLVWRYRPPLPPEIWLLWIFAAIYFGGSTVAASVARYFLIISPLLWLSIAAVLSRTVTIQFGIHDSKTREHDLS